MKICVFASGSSGNCMLLSEGGTNILIDAGISMRRIKESLAQIGLSIQDICGVLITHEHSDHVSGLKMLVKQHSLPVYAPRTVANRLRGMTTDIDSCLNIIPVGESFKLGSLSVLSFHTPHDTDESVGYRIEGKSSFAIATDMGHVTEEILNGLTGVENVLIESNHDLEKLRFGPYPFYLKRRILSERGHLSNADCAQLAAHLAQSGTKRIILGHLSRENNSPALAMEASARSTSGLPVNLYCAPESGCLKIETEEAELCSL